VPIVLKSGSLNLLEPSGPVKGCNGIALPFTVHTVGRSSIRNLGTRPAVVTGTDLSLGCGGMEWIELAQDIDRWGHFFKGTIVYLQARLIT
jgi:hypothetical protein